MARGLEENNSSDQQEQPEVVKTSAPEVHWKVPAGTKKVFLTQFDANGKKLGSHTISNYISMKPGETFVITVK